MAVIIWKNFKSNFKNFMIFFLSAMVSVAIIFSFLYMKELTENVKVNDTVSIAGWFLDKLVPILVVSSIFVMVYSTKFYIRSRMKDYSVFIVLGIRQKTLQLVVASEYLLSWLVAIGIGIVFGNIIIALFKQMLSHIPGDITYTGFRIGVIYKYTILWCMILLAGVMVSVYQYLKEQDLTEMMQSSVEGEKQVKLNHWKIPAFLGILCLLGSVLASFLIGKISKDTGVVLIAICSVGVYLTMRYGVGTFFEKMKKKGGIYYKKLIVWSQFCYRFSNNINVIFTQFLIGVACIYFAWFFLMIGDSMKADESVYPYDYVCQGETTDTKQLNNVYQEYKDNSHLFSGILVYNKSDDPRIGISQETYETLWGKTLSLQEGEIYYLWKPDNYYDLDKNPGEESFFYLGIDAKMNNKHETLLIQGEEQGVWFGNYLSPVVVFNNHDFDLYKQKYNMDTPILVMNAAVNDHGEITAVLKQLSASSTSITIQEKQKLINADNLNYYVLLAILVFAAVAVIFYLFFIISIKIVADVPLLRKKYLFLERLGMPKKEQARALKQEIHSVLVPPVVMAGTLGGIICTGLTLNGKSIITSLGTSGGAQYIFPQIIIYIILEVVLIYFLWIKIKKGVFYA